MTAREYFDRVRDASIELDRACRTLERMRAQVGVKTQRYDSPGVHGGGNADPMARVDGIIDYERVMERRMEDDRALLQEAATVLYGEDGRGGVSKGMGSAYADAVYHRACDARTWDSCARMMFMGRSRVAELYNAALDYVDSVGVEGAMAGVEV